MHAHADEIAFWTDAQRAAAAPADSKAFFEGARKVAAAYGDRVLPFRSGEIVPGLTAEPAIGHTAGHTVYRLSSGGQELFFIGDLMHAVAIQTPRPAVTLQFDSDPNRARAARRPSCQPLRRRHGPDRRAALPLPGRRPVHRERRGLPVHAGGRRAAGCGGHGCARDGCGPSTGAAPTTAAPRTAARPAT